MNCAWLLNRVPNHIAKIFSLEMEKKKTKKQILDFVADSHTHAISCVHTQTGICTHAYAHTYANPKIHVTILKLRDKKFLFMQINFKIFYDIFWF